MKLQMQKGFTLIELMIVVAIIGILASVALPAYQDYTARTQMTEALSLASGAKAAVTEFYSDRGGWPTDNDSAGIAAATAISGKYVVSVTVAAGQITAKMQSSGIAAGIQGAELTLSPVTHAGSIEWTCKSDGTTDNKYYPSSCRN